jgi:hypothetical protein
VRAVDAVQNSSSPSAPITFTLDAALPRRAYLPQMARNYPPQPDGTILIEQGKHVHRGPVTLTLTATVTNDEVKWFRIGNGEADVRSRPWVTVETPASSVVLTESWPLEGGTSGLRTVSAQFRASKGGVSRPDSAQVYLTRNGDFESRLNGWTLEREGGMRVQAVEELYRGALPPDGITGDYAARLGGDDEVYEEGGVPVGHGALWQTFSIPSVPDPTIVISYRVATHDVVYGESTRKYFDDFEVSLDVQPWTLSKKDRNDAHCNEAPPVPDIIHLNGPGLAFCDGNRSGDPTGKEDIHDAGWKTVTLRLVGSWFRGRDIRLYMANFNRVDGYWNTWTYVDEVRVNW